MGATGQAPAASLLAPLPPKAKLKKQFTVVKEEMAGESESECEGQSFSRLEAIIEEEFKGDDESVGGKSRQEGLLD